MAFWFQIPPICLATLLVITQVHLPGPQSEISAWEKFRRIDWAGSLTLMISVRHAAQDFEVSELTSENRFHLCHSPLV